MVEIVEIFADGVMDEPDPKIVAGIDVFELGDDVSAARPGEPGEVDAVRDAEVLERAEEPAVNRLVKPDFGRDPAIEIVDYILSVHPFRGGRQS